MSQTRFLHFFRGIKKQPSSSRSLIQVPGQSCSRPSRIATAPHHPTLAIAQATSRKPEAHSSRMRGIISPVFLAASKASEGSSSTGFHSMQRIKGCGPRGVRCLSCSRWASAPHGDQGAVPHPVPTNRTIRPSSMKDTMRCWLQRQRVFESHWGGKGC